MVHVSTHSVAFVLKVDLFILYILYIPLFLFFSVLFCFVFVCLQCCTEYKETVTNKQNKELQYYKHSGLSVSLAQKRDYSNDVQEWGRIVAIC